MNEDQLEVLKKVLDYILYICELNQVRRKKTEAVRNQMFEAAVLLRDEERRIESLLIPFDDFKELRDKLNLTSTTPSISTTVTNTEK